MAPKWTSIPDRMVVEEVAQSIRERGMNVIIVQDGKEALRKIKELIPARSKVMNGSSTTLEEIGFLNYLERGNHSWKNLHLEIYRENNPERREDLRRYATTADYFLGSVNAISRGGRLVSCDASGSRITAYPFAAKNLILVAGVQKITPGLEEAMKRVREYVYPLEDERARKELGTPSTLGKWIIIENEISGGRITLILVKEKLGF